MGHTVKMKEKELIKELAKRGRTNITVHCWYFNRVDFSSAQTRIGALGHANRRSSITEFNFKTKRITWEKI